MKQQFQDQGQPSPSLSQGRALGKEGSSGSTAGSVIPHPLSTRSRGKMVPWWQGGQIQPVIKTAIGSKSIKGCLRPGFRHCRTWGLCIQDGFSPEVVQHLPHFTGRG